VQAAAGGYGCLCRTLHHPYSVTVGLVSQSRRPPPSWHEGLLTTVHSECQECFLQTHSNPPPPVRVVNLHTQVDQQKHACDGVGANKSPHNGASAHHRPDTGTGQARHRLCNISMTARRSQNTHQPQGLRTRQHAPLARSAVRPWGKKKQLHRAHATTSVRPWGLQPQHGQHGRGGPRQVRGVQSGHQKKKQLHQSGRRSSYTVHTRLRRNERLAIERSQQTDARDCQEPLHQKA
jgi:hypothetical protein